MFIGGAHFYLSPLQEGSRSTFRITPAVGNLHDAAGFRVAVSGLQTLALHHQDFKPAAERNPVFPRSYDPPPVGMR